MKLTAPIYILKQKAKDLKRTEAIPMTEALNRIAREEGFSSWSLLASKAKAPGPKTKEGILDYVNPGDLLLIGARPGQGKTQLALQLLLRAAKAGTPGFFFTFEYTHQSLLQKLAALEPTYERYKHLLTLDFSEKISSEHIIRATNGTVEKGSLIAIDYLQLLDQQRSKPPLQSQIQGLKKYARKKKCIIICISQIDRAFEQKEASRPSLADVRLPNPLDLTLFNKSLFMQDEQIYI